MKLEGEAPGLLEENGYVSVDNVGLFALHLWCCMTTICCTYFDWLLHVGMVLHSDCSSCLIAIYLACEIFLERLSWLVQV